MPQFNDSCNQPIYPGDQVICKLHRDGQTHTYEGHVVELATPPGTSIVLVQFADDRTGWFKRQEVTVQNANQTSLKIRQARQHKLPPLLDE